MRAREPDADGYVDHGGAKLHWEAFGDGAPTLLLLPAWTIIHARSWKAQVPYLSRHFRGGHLRRAGQRPLRPAAFGNVVIGPGLDLEAWDETVIPPFDEPYTSTEGWARYNRHYWLERWEDFVEFFFSQCLLIRQFAESLPGRAAG